MDLDLKKSIFNLRGRLMHFNAIKESKAFSLTEFVCPTTLL